MNAKISSRVSVYAALAGNVLVAATKAVAAAWTGSASMVSEAIHSSVDTANEALLLYGINRARRRADELHPLGYGREVYFWSFIVALLIFALGAGVSIYQGVMRVLHPVAITDALVNYVVLALAFVFEGASWIVSLRQFRAAKRDLGYYEGFVRSKDPPSFIVLFEDSAALVGIVLAAAGICLATTLDMPEADGIASVLIGLVLAGVSILLARESKSLLIGERADRRFAESVLRIAAAEPGVESANGVLALQVGPEQVVVALSLHFADRLRATEIEAIVVRIEGSVRAAHPGVLVVFVKPQDGDAYHTALKQRYGRALTNPPFDA